MGTAVFGYAANADFPTPANTAAHEDTIVKISDGDVWISRDGKAFGARNDCIWGEGWGNG
jgi:hypothetical protein